MVGATEQQGSWSDTSMGRGLCQERRVELGMRQTDHTSAGDSLLQGPKLQTKTRGQTRTLHSTSLCL